MVGDFRISGESKKRSEALNKLQEPSTGLDDKSALKITNLINHIAAQSDTAIIYVSHRKEKGLHPDFEYELFPTENGSVGKIKIQ